MTHILVWNRPMTERAARYVSAAVKRVDADAVVEAGGCSPNDPAFIRHPDADLAFIPVRQIRAAASNAVKEYQRLHPRARVWL